MALGKCLTFLAFSFLWSLIEHKIAWVTGLGVPRTPGEFCYHPFRKEIYQFGQSLHNTQTESLVLNDKGLLGSDGSSLITGSKSTRSCHCSVLVSRDLSPKSQWNSHALSSMTMVFLLRRNYIRYVCLSLATYTSFPVLYSLSSLYLIL